MDDIPVVQNHSHSMATHVRDGFGCFGPRQKPHKLIMAMGRRTRSAYEGKPTNKQIQALTHSCQPGRVMAAYQAVGRYGLYACGGISVSVTRQGLGLGLAVA